MAEMTEQEELQVFQLITAAGSAKSTFMEALYKAKEGKYDEAEKLFKEADGYFVEGHHAHTAMIEAEGQGVETTVRLVLAHAEDQLMSAELTKTMVEEMIALYKKLDQLKTAAVPYVPAASVRRSPMRCQWIINRLLSPYACGFLVFAWMSGDLG